MRIINFLAQSIAYSSMLMFSSLVQAQEHHENRDEEKYMMDHRMQHTDASIDMMNNPSIRNTLQQPTTVPSDLQQHVHHQEHGGQIYSAVTLENQWMLDDGGHGKLKSKIDAWMGSDENKIFIKGQIGKAESFSKNYAIAALYSRNIADFWDVQFGAQYTDDSNRQTQQNTVNGMFGLHGMAAYFFKTDAYFYMGEHQQISFSLETERDLLLTQKWIAQPYLDLKIVLNDDSDDASKTGLSDLQVGIKTRYEVSKKVMPFVDVAYQYDKGKQQTLKQERSVSESGWLYGAGILFKF